MQKNKTKGFTLAEVLIVLGIIGVVAALSAPALIQRAAAAKTGPAISRMISTLSNGFQSYMQQNDADTVKFAKASIASNPVAIFEELANGHVKMKKESSSPLIKRSVGDTVGVVPSGKDMFVFADKSAVILPTNSCDPVSGELVAAEGGEGGAPAVLGGCKFYFLLMGYGSKDNIFLGDDAFEFAYDNKGEILVYGLDYGTSWETDCSDSAIASFTPASDKSTCGGRIVANGYKKDY